MRMIFTHLKHTNSNWTGCFEWVKSRPGDGISIKLMFKTAKEVTLLSMLLLFHLRDTCGTLAGHLVTSSVSAPFCTGKTAHTQDPKDI